MLSFISDPQEGMASCGNYNNTLRELHYLDKPIKHELQLQLLRNNIKMEKTVDENDDCTYFAL